MAIFGFVSLTLARSIMQSRKMAEGSIYQTTAYGVVYGYSEQIMAMDYEDFILSIEDTTIPLEMRAISPSSTSGSADIEDDLFLDSWTGKDIVLDVHGEGGAQQTVVMPMRIRVTANRLDSGSDPRDAIEIKLEYTYETPATRTTTTISDSLHFVKSAVPIY